MEMYGLLKFVASDGSYGKVDTRSDKYGILSIYKVPMNLPINTTVKFQLVLSSKNNYYAKFIEVADRNMSLYNTEDRKQWYKWGEGKEDEFIATIVPNLQNEIIINPEKESDPTRIDLYDLTNERYADLKVQDTPFFTSGRYCYNGIPYDPSYTVTFNRKDYENYRAHHPDCDIYFWVSWQQLSYRDIKVESVEGIWRASFSRMSELIENGIVALHPYIYRQNDDHNAKDSFLFNLNDPTVFERIM